MNITVKKPSTLFDFLIEQYPDSPRTRIKKILQGGFVRINNKSVTLHSFDLQPGDVVEINHRSGMTVRATLPIQVLYEDGDVIVVDKPAGISTSSTDGSRNIQSMVSEVLIKLTKGKERAHVVHRLDKEVSGVLLFARSHDAMETLKERWKETEKHYFALVEGMPEKEAGTIESWLIEDKSQKVHSTFEREGAKFSVTHYRVIRHLDRHTLLDIATDTGRKNQIRVHLSDMGCPIVGDRKYGASVEYKRRVRLHAWSLMFPHPTAGRNVTVESSMPKGFLVLKDKDEHYK